MTTQHDERAKLIRKLNEMADRQFHSRVPIYHTVGLMRQTAALLAADAQAGGEAVAFIHTVDIGKPVCSVYAPKEFHSWPNKRLVTDGVYAPLYTHPQPQAVAQGWKLPYVDRSEAVNLARNYLYSSLCKPLTQAGAEILAHAVLKMDAAMLSASPAAPAAQVAQEIEQLIRERDHRDEIIDRLCDAALGEDRHEWSSAYGFEDAVADVEERINQLHQPSVDRAWARFEQAHSQQAAQVAQPLTEEQVTAGAQALCRITAVECGTNADDEWAIYSEVYKGNARAVLAAAHGIGKDHA